MDLFIEKVKAYTYLWDTSHLSYRDITKRESAWEQIASECGMANGREAKSLWKKLRDSHREALRRRRTATGQPVLNLKPWKYEALMEFVLPLAEQRAAAAHLSNEARAGIQDILDINPDTLLEAASSPVPEASFQLLPSSDPERRKQRKLHDETFQQRREEERIERDNLRREAIDIDRGVDAQDALSNFFTSLCQKTRDLPKYLQLRVQREIFESVTRAEEETLDSPRGDSSACATCYRCGGVRHSRASAAAGDRNNDHAEKNVVEHKPAAGGGTRSRPVEVTVTKYEVDDMCE